MAVSRISVHRPTLEALKQQRGMTVRELAAAADVPRSTVHRLLTAVAPTCEPETAERLASALGVAIGVLTGQPDGAEPPLSVSA
jgi:plasmid maintenance system antidote protein VapI